MMFVEWYFLKRNYVKICVFLGMFISIFLIEEKYKVNWCKRNKRQRNVLSMFYLRISQCHKIGKFTI